MIDLTIPCTYQGGKQRLAKQIVSEINTQTPIKNQIFYDVCCGSGAITLEVLKYQPKEIVMLDNGCMGLFWKAICENKFDLSLFKKKIKELPQLDKIQDYLKGLSNKPVNYEELVYDYILMQAGAFGSKQIWVKNNKWCNCTFRNYWLPTESSNRKSPVNPMMPLPSKLYERIELLATELPKYNIKVYTDNALDVLHNISDFENSIIYVDPPYMNTQGYGSNLNIYTLINFLQGKTPLYISEGLSLNNSSVSTLLGTRNKGNISGKRKKEPVQEYLNYFQKI